MDGQFDSLKRLGLELLGLTVAMSLVVVIAAYHVFGGLSGGAGRLALGFSLAVLALTSIPIQVYVAVRMSRLHAANGNLFTRATRDGLTQVLNKTTFRERVEAEIASLHRRRGEETLYTLLIVDADHFKRINDRLGHATGDQALVAISSALRTSVRSADIVGRIGGEEFAILLKGAGVEEARIVAERLRGAINQLTVGRGAQPMQLSVSMGGITFASALPYELIYRAADAGLYRAKKNGRNRVDLTSAVRRQARAEGDNRGATSALSRILP